MEVISSSTSSDPPPEEGKKKKKTVVRPIKSLFYAATEAWKKTKTAKSLVEKNKSE
jgi:hypothetical protein